MFVLNRVRDFFFRVLSRTQIKIKLKNFLTKCSLNIKIPRISHTVIFKPVNDSHVNYSDMIFRF